MSRALAHRLRPGDPVRVAFAKWGGGPHWSGDCIWLGEDEHGRWAGWVDGTVRQRPGASFVSRGRQVGLFPPSTAVDLDLDVIQRFDATCFVDDEDEFAEPRCGWAIPPRSSARPRRSVPAWSSRCLRTPHTSPNLWPPIGATN